MSGASQRENAAPGVPACDKCGKPTELVEEFEFTADDQAALRERGIPYTWIAGEWLMFRCRPCDTAQFRRKKGESDEGVSSDLESGDAA
jgi:hypothetical protein